MFNCPKELEGPSHYLIAKTTQGFDRGGLVLREGCVPKHICHFLLYFGYTLTFQLTLE